ncbi:hypothetical protein ERO13_D02G187200v2 [Gossypium hirsutum]|uniref:Zinc finger CCCH domain-containing protein 13 isoform X3 n=4 Tax=Gossypium TaxID=3633 RepID=A0ABM2ZRN8_GOSHI|nr:zinc finger CCCH domain-containing protein 13 isoform X3 [Gossypium hirsutum]KAB2042422.1 hypothetical protein ES319_D02G215100v1 [Gossypium barbadense]KAG4159634.1 hypothetical protein ERO13_D02G187200v2 [Gossypium hirsutum]TYG80621.1 hypothetical protein ES288_D02G231300v1 [Gossypium darwinii]TYH84987.1 hypothetical protein ES332_D02G234200v1 [Gossypium tomentosum]
MVERKLFKTKLCVLYQRGHCSRQSCSFAHGDADLRGFSGSYGGKRNFRDGDLRDKLDRRLSPKRRYSPARYVRDQQISQRYSPLRSIDKKRNRKKKECLDGQSDFPETLKIPNVMEDLVIEGRNTSSTSKSILEDQLKEVRVDIDMLINRKHELETFVEEKVQEAETLTSQIEELDTQLEREKEQCKKITSRIKKFVKAHNRCSQIEDELRRSQARLQKSGEQLVLHISGTSGDEENSNVNIVSDGKALQAETVRLGKRSRWSERPSQSNIDKENGSLKNGNSSAVPLASNEKPRKGKKVSVRTSTTDKLKGARSSLSLPLTSMAAHAVDDVEILEVEEEKVEASALPFLLPPPPPIRQNGYSQYEGNDRNVDVDRVDVI